MSKGILYIVSTGPGNINYLTNNAIIALQTVDLIVGYKKYINDIFQIIENKELYTTGMGNEVERCKYAIQHAINGQKVAIISNGDVNIYGMAGLVLEIIEENNLWNKLDLSIEPGITSLLAAASKAGAPIMNDFAVISLSDLLTPLDSIIIRIKYALEADFVLCLYNVQSHNRREPYKKFINILNNYCNKDTPVVIAKNLARDNENILISNVEFLINEADNTQLINMSTIIILGNSSTKFVKSGKLVVTPRGYQNNYDYKIK